MNPFGLDNHADNIRYYELMLERPDLNDLPESPLPDGFRFAMYQPGDRDAWIGIEYSAKEFHCFADGVRAWNNYYAPHETELPGRMVFVETADGEKVATATAFYDVRSDDHTDGWLHWVAVKRKYQGMGLSKPLIAHTLGLLRAMGHTRTVIPTQTYT